MSNVPVSASQKLTLKQEKFCQKCVELGVLSHAYRQVYDCSESSDIVIRKESSLLFKLPHIKERVNQLNAMMLERMAVTVERVVAEYAKIAFFDIRKIYDAKGNLLPISELDDFTAGAITQVGVEELYEGYGRDRQNTGQLKTIMMANKKSALDSLAKYLGMFTDKTEISGPNGGPIEISDAKATLLRGLVQDATSGGTVIEGEKSNG